MISFRFGFALLLLVIFGAIVFLWQIFGAEPARAWQAFLINLLFFSAVAQSGSILAAIYHLTEARWGRSVMPVAIGLGSFLPISFVLFVVLFVGFPYLPKYSAEFPARQAWFNPFFFAGRDLLAIAILYSVSLAFSYRFSNMRLAGSSRHGSLTATGDPRTAATRGEQTIEAGPNARKITGLAVLVLGIYAIVFSLIGFDLVMALDQQWYSTLFGGYFFISSFYIGLAAITVTVFVVNKYWQAREQVRANALRDLGKLVFAFCLLTAYFFWAQYLITWYGNLPEEVGFFIRRFRDPSWQWLTWLTVALTFAIPFLTLLSQRTKQTTILCFIAVTVLIGMWLERYILIAPSLGLTAGPALGWIEAAITLSFLSTMIFSCSVYLNLYETWEGKSELAAI